MGLDMYAWSVDPADLPEQDVVRQVDVKMPKDEGEVHELWYWRKHHDLHGWMERLYREKGGAAESFNCVTVRLTMADLERLERDISDHKLPQTTGYFFGNYPPDEYTDEYDRKFIAAAKEAINNQQAVFYDSWW